MKAYSEELTYAAKLNVFEKSDKTVRRSCCWHEHR